MNQPFRPGASKEEDVASYERDVYGWAMRQGRLLRERAGDAIDWDNIAEEIETVGRSERRSLSSNLTQLLIHMMKWDAQPERRGKSWFLSIRNHRLNAIKDLRDNPSLKATLDTLVAEAMEEARDRASDETDLPRSRFESLSYSLEDVFERSYENPSRG